jgi:iron-sulfur cluster repair protein YtfE (RIC family)
LCGTHRALLDALRSLEQDLHQHIHEENNVLLPRVRALNAMASTPTAKEGGEP